MFEEGKVFSKIDNRECVSYIFLGIFDCEIKPFIIALCIGIVLYKEDIVIMLGEAFVD